MLAREWSRDWDPRSNYIYIRCFSASHSSQISFCNKLF